MLRSIIVLIAMGAGALYLYRMQEPPASPVPEKRISRDTSGIRSLEGRLPGIFFEKEVAPLVRENETGGLTAAQSEALVENLRNAGRELGKEAGRGIDEAIRKFAPEHLREKDGRKGQSMGSWLSSASDSNMEDIGTSLSRYAEMFLKGLINTFSRLLELAAEQLRK